MEFDLLQVQKRTYKKPKEGDIFSLKPKDNLYCFGKVIKTNVKSSDSFMNGMNLIFVYDFFSKTNMIPDDLEKNEIMFVAVVNHQPWRRGYAYNISWSKVTEEDINEDYAFWSVGREKYVDLTGNAINRKPRYKGTFGLGSYGALGEEIRKELQKRGL